jgi:hypothetical protein
MLGHAPPRCRVLIRASEVEAKRPRRLSLEIPGSEKDGLGIVGIWLVALCSLAKAFVSQIGGQSNLLLSNRKQREYRSTLEPSLVFIPVLGC